MQGIKSTVPEKQILTEYYACHSVVETASYFGVSKSTIRAWCKQLGITKRIVYKDVKTRKLKQSESCKRWRENNHDKYLKQRKKYRKRYYSSENGKNRRKNDALKVYYGISLEDYNTMLQNQNYRCAICNAESPGHKHKYFCVDHDHQTNKVRGLLCHRCNRGMGFFEKVIDYINKHKKEESEYYTKSAV